jgi:riboflavin biosynthesis pyrimidine reductase
MGLLRSVSDAVLVGSRTFNEGPGHMRIPTFIYPEAKDLYAELRRKLGKPPLPLSVILTASGKVDLDEPTFHTEDTAIALRSARKTQGPLFSLSFYSIHCRIEQHTAASAACQGASKTRTVFLGSGPDIRTDPL